MILEIHNPIVHTQLMPVSNTLATPQHKNQLPEIMMRMDDNTFIEPQDGLRNNCSQPCVRQATTPFKIGQKYRKKSLYLSSLKMDYEKISYSHVSDRLPHRSKLVKNTEKTLSSVVVGLKSFNIFDNEFSLTGFIRRLMRSTFQAMVLNVLFVSKIIIECSQCSHHKNWKIKVV